MKRLITAILILVLILPATSLANTEEELIGTWVGSSEFYYGEVTYFMFRFYDDHTALYEANKIQMFEDEPDGFVYEATWELMEDGVHVHYNNFWDKKKKDEKILYLTQAHYLAYPLATSYIMFVKLPQRKEAGSFHTVSNWD